MHYSEDKYSIGFNAVEHAIRESAGKTTADITFQRRPRFWIGKDVLDRRMDFDRKVLTETWFAFFLVINCFEKFCFGFRMEQPFHRTKRSLTLAKT